MGHKIICIISIFILFANVEYAQLITITTLGKTVKRTEFSPKSSFIDLVPVVEVTASKMVEREKRDPDVALPLDLLSVTSAFGKRFHPIYHFEKLHSGVDLKASYKAVYAFASGIVSQAAYDAKSGNYITILHGRNGRLLSMYAHLSYLTVLPGDKVQAGQLIGISGGTGSSTAPHLHFALKVDNRPLDPLPMLKYLVQIANSHRPNQQYRLMPREY